MSAIEDAEMVNEETPHDFIEDLKRSVEKGLPTSSYIVGEVIKTIYDESSSANELAEIIERDPPLTAKILKIANSTYYGSSKRITSLQRAVVTLGFATIKELVTTMAIVHSFFKTDSTAGVDRTGLWLHSVGTAKASQIISVQTGITRPDITYTIGLLHDIGKIVLALSFPDIYRKVIEYTQEKNVRIIQAEHAVLNINHCMIGKILCSIWELPETLSTAILYHHNPLDIPDGDSNLAKIIHIGDQMCRKAEIGNPGDTFKFDPEPGALEILGDSAKVASETYDGMINKLLGEKEEIEGFFSGL